MALLGEKLKEDVGAMSAQRFLDANFPGCVVCTDTSIMFPSARCTDPECERAKNATDFQCTLTISGTRRNPA